MLGSTPRSWSRSGATDFRRCRSGSTATRPMGERPEIGEIARRLADRIDTLAVELLPVGHREGREWRAGSVGGEAGFSLGVHLVGNKRGVWSDFATGER